MQVGTRLPISLAKKIYKSHKRHHTSNRGWAINNGFASSTPFEFDYAVYDKDSYADMWRMNVELHDAMNEYWNDSIGDESIIRNARTIKWIARIGLVRCFMMLLVFFGRW